MADKLGTLWASEKETVQERIRNEAKEVNKTKFVDNAILAFGWADELLAVETFFRFDFG
jgi:hypothetical protein